MAFQNTATGQTYYAKYRAENRERIAQRDKEYRDNNKAKLQQTQREYRRRNNDAIKARQKTYRDSEAGRAYNAAYTAIYYANPSNRMRLLVNGAILRSKKQGKPFDESLREKLMSSPPLECPCCYRPLDYSMKRGRNNRDRSPSLDRFDNLKGYTLENVRVICMKCNDLKGSATAAELEQVLAYLRTG